MYYWMPLPVASLRQLSASFWQHWEVPRPYYMPNVVIATLGTGTYVTECQPGLIHFNQTVDFTVFLVWTPPTDF